MTENFATSGIDLVERDHAITYLLTVGQHYWTNGDQIVRSLPIAKSISSVSYEITAIALPDWASDLGVYESASLLVDASCVIDGKEPAWKRCDWWRAAWLHLTGWVERHHENQYGPTHSNFSKMGHQGELYDHAWVNRIFMFLKRWAARTEGKSENELFGALPMPIIYLEHDVDYLTKTIPHRLKRAIVDSKNLYAGVSHTSIAEFLTNCWNALSMALLPGNYNCIEEMAVLEAQYDVRSRFYIYAGRSEKSKRSWLIDPGYQLSDELMTTLKSLSERGWGIGIHPGYHTWNNVDALKAERHALEVRLDRDITHCRQHWLRFSWQETWKAQSRSGLKVDATLGFNDRAGFRNGAAIRHSPYGQAGHGVLNFEAMPMVAMDSHFFDTGILTHEERQALLDRYLNELRFVGGEAAIVWHQRSLHPDYGWGALYEYLLQNAGEMIAAPD